jgi:hypothetical protein
MDDKTSDVSAPKKMDIAARLRKMADEMDDISVAMDSTMERASGSSDAINM